MKRRAFFKRNIRLIASAIVSLFCLSVLAQILKRKPVIAEGEPEILRPPGAGTEDEFLAECIRCQRCRDACPSGAIQLTGFWDTAQLGTPFIEANNSACTLCLDCTQVCPTEALKPLFEKSEVKMGLAVVDDRLCVSINGSGVCGACHTACPFRNFAITQGLRNAPTVHEDYCVGCGLCEEACILEGTKAIRVYSGRSAA